MREIRFRIYNPALKKFEYSGATPMLLANFFRRTAVLNTRDGQVYEQYTGLKDKNDVEICEGDMISPGKREVLFIAKGEGHIGVGFHTLSHDNEESVEQWGDLAKIPWSFGATQAEDSEIIGTIHEHTEETEQK